MRQSEKIEQLRQEADRVGEKFIEADMEAAMTFLQLAKTEFETGNHERGGEVLAKAGRAYEAVAGFLPKIEDSDRKQQLQRKCHALREAIRKMEAKHLGMRR